MQLSAKLAFGEHHLAPTWRYVAVACTAGAPAERWYLKPHSRCTAGTVQGLQSQI